MQHLLNLGATNHAPLRNPALLVRSPRAAIKSVQLDCLPHCQYYCRDPLPTVPRRPDVGLVVLRRVRKESRQRDSGSHDAVRRAVLAFHQHFRTHDHRSDA